jgi:hypothetical protein
VHGHDKSPCLPLFMRLRVCGSAPRGGRRVEVTYKMAAPGSLEWGEDQIGTNVPSEQEDVSFDRESIVNVRG